MKKIDSQTILKWGPAIMAIGLFLNVMTIILLIYIANKVN